MLKLEERLEDYEEEYFGKFALDYGLDSLRQIAKSNLINFDKLGDDYDNEVIINVSQGVRVRKSVTANDTGPTRQKVFIDGKRQSNIDKQQILLNNQMFQVGVGLDQTGQGNSTNENDNEKPTKKNQVKPNDVTKKLKNNPFQT